MSIGAFLQRVIVLILNPLILLALALSVVYFIWSIIRFLNTNAEDKGTERVEARNAILWSIVGMVIMISVFGLIRFVLASFGITNTDLGGAAPYL